MKKVIETLKKILVCIFILSISIAIVMRSEQNPIANRVPTIDSDVYIYIGEELNNGKVIYKDIFDHKGPLFHFIEFIGVKASFNNGYIGIWIIEVISMLITMIFLYKTSKQITLNRLISCFVLFVSAVPLSLFFINGNYPEEYSLPFISVSLYYIVKYLINDEQMTLRKGLIIGSCFACVALIKLNLISVWAIFILCIWGKLAFKKNWDELKKCVLYLFVGAIVPIIIVIVVLLFQGNFIECIKQYILFNFKYATDTEGSLEGTLKLFGTKAFYISIIACLFDVIYRIVSKKHGKLLTVSSLVYLLVAFYIVIMPRNEYRHYGMILTPAYIVPLSILVKDFFEIIQADEYIITRIIGIVFLLYAILDITRRDIVTFKKDLYIANTERFALRETKLTNYIKENTDEDDNILVLGNECNIYLMSERWCNCKHIYQIPIVRIDSNIMNETINEIKENKPELIVLKITNYTEVANSFYKYLEETNAYEKVTAFDNYDVYLINEE